MLDLLSLPAATAKPHSCSSSREGEDAEGIMEVASEEGSHVIYRLETPLLLSWKRLQSVLGCTFSEALRLKDSDNYQLLHCLEHSHGAKKSSQFETGRKVNVFSAMCVQLSRTTSTLLTAASNKELHFIMEQLLSIKVRIV